MVSLCSHVGPFHSSAILTKLRVSKLKMTWRVTRLLQCAPLSMWPAQLVEISSLNAPVPTSGTKYRALLHLQEKCPRWSPPQENRPQWATPHLQSLTVGSTPRSAGHSGLTPGRAAHSGLQPRRVAQSVLYPWESCPRWTKHQESQPC